MSTNILPAGRAHPTSHRSAPILRAAMLGLVLLMTGIVAARAMDSVLVGLMAGNLAFLIGVSLRSAVVSHRLA